MIQEINSLAKERRKNRGTFQRVKKVMGSGETAVVCLETLNMRRGQESGLHVIEDKIKHIILA